LRPNQIVAATPDPGTSSESVSDSVEALVRHTDEGARTPLGIRNGLRILVSGIVIASVLTFAGAWSSASAKTLAPIKVFTTGDINDPAIQDPGSPWGAKAATADINRHGGINGHKLVDVWCDEANEATLAETCARQAVSDDAVATVGAHESFAALTFPIYQAASISMIGLYPASVSPDVTSSISFPFFAGGEGSSEAGVLALKKQGITKIGVLALQTTSGLGNEKALEPYIAKAGSKFVGSVFFPPSATDFTPYVEQLHSDGAQGVLMVSSGTEDAQILQAADSLNINDITWAAVANVTESNLANVSASTKMVLPAPYPPFRSSKKYSGIAKWLTDLKAVHAPSGPQYTSSIGLNSWLAVMAFSKIAAKIRGPITAQSVTAALQSQKKAIDLYGIVSWQPNKSGPSSSPRAANGDYYEEVLRHGQLQLESSQRINVYKPAG
jgi:ABC-type branched-subunit amino acid transport system substrate-binding protein